MRKMDFMVCSMGWVLAGGPRQRRDPLGESIANAVPMAQEAH